jgi:porphobilinogen synthase
MKATTMFPTVRGRRLRRTAELRRLVRETVLSPADFILPAFVVEGEGIRRPVGSMPGVEQVSIDGLLADAAAAVERGIGGMMLFGLPVGKDPEGSGAYAEDGIIQKAVRALKQALPHFVVITDVCLCEYTSHGHCGILRGNEVDNDLTLPLLAQVALSHARAGADIVAPSDMMDGRIGVIRAALDEAGYSQTIILAYAAKYASAFYGPFRDAADSAPQFGDRKGYQMDGANSDEAIREVLLDIGEGADILMVKPALPSLDIIRRIKEETRYPVCAYQVSGEFAAIMAAAERGWLDGDAAMLESVTAIKRAGADMIVTYGAMRLVDLLKA